MSEIPNCPACDMGDAYLDGFHYVCPYCAHEWSPEEEAEKAEAARVVTRDAHGNELQDGDSVFLVKDLKVKGSSLVIKTGTKINNIRIIDGDHDIDCKVDGVSLQLKSEFMRKA